LPALPPSAGLSTAMAGVLAATPPCCYALGGLLAPRIALRLGPARTITVALAVMTASQVVRVLGGTTWLIIGTATTAVATMLVAALLPVLAGATGDGLARLTAVYATAIGVGSTLGAFLTAPVVSASSWHVGLGVWALPCAAALVVWRLAEPCLPGASQDQRTPNPTRGLLRDPLAWMLTTLFAAWAAVAFTIMAWLPSVYRDAGLSAEAAGALLGLAALVGVPVSAVLPRWTRRMHSGRFRYLPVCTVGSVTTLGVLGLLWAPASLPWIWAAALGVGLGTLSLVMTLVPLRVPERASITAVSAMTQGVGYALAGAVGAGIGAVYAASGEWWPMLLIVLALIAVQTAAGVRVTRGAIGARRESTAR
jgi:MFS transporter, CP family, cyanate transporter